jgi:hypothetical protein
MQWRRQCIPFSLTWSPRPLRPRSDMLIRGWLVEVLGWKVGCCGGIELERMLGGMEEEEHRNLYISP